MEGHAGFQLGAVAGPQAHGALAPIRWVADPDRIAAAAVLLDSVACQYAEERACDALAGAARPRRLEPGRDSFLQRLLGIEELLRRLAEEDGARQWAVIAPEAAGDLEIGP